MNLGYNQFSFYRIFFKLMNNIVRMIQSFEDMADEQIAARSRQYFKTGPGEYGEGDLFLGIPVPVLRQMRKDYKSFDLESIFSCLKNKYHEIRLFSLFLLIDRFKQAGPETQTEIYQHYLNHSRWINNWDLVDSSAPHIIGAFLYEKDRKDLYRLAHSADLWERRMSIVSTYYFIQRDSHQETLNLAEILLNDRHDLIHKAVGWMLREVGKREMERAQHFLKIHYKTMPRTMLRYAIERYPESERQDFLRGRV